MEKGGFFMPRKIKIDNKNTQTIQEGFKEFLRSREVKNESIYTTKYYQNIIVNFSKFQDLSMQLHEVDKRLIEDYIIYLRDKNLAGRTIFDYVTGLMTMLYYLMELELLIPFKIKRPKYEKALKETYTDAELRLLLEKPKKGYNFTDFRDWTIINFFIGTGVRLNTLINIKIGDLNLDEGIFALRIVKNRKPTILPISQTLVIILKKYLKLRRGDETDYLFCNATGGQITRSGITDAVRFYNKNRGVNKTSIHAFRHTFAKKYLMSGGDVFRLQRLMCHKDLNSTKEYLSMNLTDLMNEYDNLNPLEQLQK